MCGILFSIQDQGANEQYDRTWATLQELNARRGPSAQDTHNIVIKQQHESTTHQLTFYGAVLHLRGDVVTHQPHLSKSGNVLLWNGEIFDGIFVDHHQNDGRVLMEQLESISDLKDHWEAFLNTMAKIEGPYAFVYFHASSQKLYFGRDCLGRRSLLWHKRGQDDVNVESPFILTSVGYSSFHSDLMALEEVPADGIYRLSLSSGDSKDMARYPWVSSGHGQGTFKNTAHIMNLPFGKVNRDVPTETQLSEPFPGDVKFDQAHPEIVPTPTEDMMKAIVDMIDVLGDSVRRRVQDIPRTGLPHDARVGILFSGGLDCLCLAALADRFLPEGEAIDLLNVGFENPRSEKAKAAEEALALKRMKKLGLSPQLTVENNINSRISPAKYNVPDRATGYESLSELKRIAPKRHWNFVEVNVPFEEAMTHRSEILERIAPLETVMDLSIAMAFWFAARGVGYIKNDQGEMMPYTSQAKVLLSGLGADEQLGGYSRHKEQFKNAGWEGLIEELQLDLDRISTRNLGRDDRIISDHGKEARYPFLSTNVVQFLSSLRVDLKVDLRYPRGVGEKILLRHVARQLGFVRASSHWKRAVQFGARTAKMTESGRSEIGQQVVDRGQES
ncbi:Asparagine synthetase domain-containing protein 1 [Mortierella sp. GBA30]|nr:Asparagine synthetase domain-containing protein 1 [Mortierella sp. GBA30]